jgi:hypothetical protein
MTKRFTPKASDFTSLLADTQKDISRLKAQLAELEAKERNLKGYLSKFFDQGVTEVDYGDKTLIVTYTESERNYLDQQKAKVLLARAGMKVPTFTSKVLTFKVKKG